MRRLPRYLGAGAMLLVLLSSCREATRIVLDISTDVPCERVQRTTITASTPKESEVGLLSSTETESCTNGVIGDLTVVPESGTGSVVSVRVVVGIDRPAQECKAEEDYRGCIVARRQLRYIAHTALFVPIRAFLACKDVICDVNSTCNKLGRCVPATLNAEDCKAPGGCDVDQVQSGAPDAGTDTAADVDAQAVPPCPAAVEALCDRIAACSTYTMQATFGDSTTCKRRLGFVCTNFDLAPGYQVNAAQWKKCAADVPGFPCEDVVYGPLVPPSCTFAGSLPASTPCGDDLQCATGFCDRTVGECGTCVVPVGEGADCSASPCAPGLQCSSQKKCIAPKAGTILSLGAPCNVTKSTEHCNQALGQVCTVSGDAGDVDGFCKQSRLANDGVACGTINGEPVWCLNGDCRQLPGQSKKCFGFRDIGAACDEVNGPFCDSAFVCRAGTCAARFPGTCK